MEVKSDRIINLNVGGYKYVSTLKVLTSEANSLFDELNNDESTVFIKKDKNQVFVDRNGELFKLILDYLNLKTLHFYNNFNEMKLLKCEAEFFKLKNLVTLIDESGKSGNSKPSIGSINLKMALLPNVNHMKTQMIKNIRKRKPNAAFVVIGYRGTFEHSHLNHQQAELTDLRFRKISRILISGRAETCIDVFKENLNERLINSTLMTKDPDHGKYTSRFYLNHNSLEQAFDTLLDADFRLVGCTSTGANSIVDDSKINILNEENKFNYYFEYIFVKT